MELLERYRRDRGSAALAALLEAYRPLVVSVCRRYFRERADIDDAAQTVFAKMVRHIDLLQDGAVSWLTRTSHSTCIDMIRRAVRDRQRLTGLAAQRPKNGAHPPRAAIDHSNLQAALRHLAEPSRQWIVERFYQQNSLRDLAAQKNISLATASRRVGNALDELKSVLGTLDDQPDCFDESLRIAADWQTLGYGRTGELPLIAGNRPGWTRRIRVGAFVSHSGATVESLGFYMTVDRQLAWSLDLNAGFDVVGIVEPATAEIGHIERALREFELTAGLIEGTDRQALSTLDVIVMPPTFAYRHDVMAAVCDVVSGGVGLYNHWWKGHTATWQADELVIKVMLSRSPIGMYHTPEGHSWPVPATVLESHPTIAGLSPGDALQIGGCGPLYRAIDSARVLVAKDARVTCPGIHHLGPMRVPVLLAGQIGRGRVIVDHQGMPPLLAAHPSLGRRFTTNVLEWLAAGKDTPDEETPPAH